ncbi:MAG: S1C family serine protease [Flavisolibacter sp.]
MKLKQILLTVAISFLSAFLGLVVYQKLFGQTRVIIESNEQNSPVRYTKFMGSNTTGETMDFTKAATAAVPAVVHIKTKVSLKKMKNRNSPDDELFGPGLWPYLVPEQRASGSGVIVSDDGYLVTNNHVISDEAGGVADDINVTLSNGKQYKARVIGRSETDDIAVLKIDAKNLPYLIFGNSDLLQTGQWVLAVGYPLTLEATVTAGIISGTGRSLAMRNRQVKNGENSPSYIQTDAAVNSGNSGGALIDTDGNLIGINAAIMSPTGTYAGYSFAVPVNVVKKSVKEIIQAGGFSRGS